MSGLPGGVLPGRSTGQPPAPPRPKTGMRWGLITFAPNQEQLDRVARYMPLIRTLTIQASPSFQRQLGNTAPYEEWAADQVVRATMAGYDIYLGLADSPDDFAALADYGPPTLEVVLERLAVPKLRRRLIALSLDREWENPRYVHGGAAGYVEQAAPVVTAVREIGLPVVGPGGTHSDDKSLAQVLQGMAARAASFDVGSFHWYADKGWDRSVERIDSLSSTFQRFGYGPLWATECGVTGQENWGDRDHDGSAVERHGRRFGRMKALFDPHPWIETALIYQITEPPAPAGEDHGWGFGMFSSDWVPKPSVEYFQLDDDREGRR